jgi:hypothetical protein
MWLCLNNAFVSVVRNYDDPTGKTLLVRARKRNHLKRVFGSKVEITETPKRDYRWRCTVPRDVMSWVMDWHCQNIEYTNFKNSVAEEDLHHMYSLWWSDHSRLQQDDLFLPKGKGKKGKGAFEP